MKVIQPPGPIRLAVVCCVHGDEAFGERVFKYYAKHPDEAKGVRFILANEEALAVRKRFIDNDLNRNFPGGSDGKHEQRLAAEMMPLLQDAKIVIDLHTTTSHLIMTPIVANLGKGVQRVINLTNSAEVVVMKPSIVRHALIGNVAAGVSLEFNTHYARTPEAMLELRRIIAGVASGDAYEPVVRRVFRLDGTIARSVELPTEVANFRKPANLDFYPFLPNGKSYATHRGFMATRVEEVRL